MSKNFWIPSPKFFTEHNILVEIFETPVNFYDQPKLRNGFKTFRD